MSLVRRLPDTEPGNGKRRRGEGSVVRALGSAFNVVALNLSVVVLALGVVTAPLAVTAAERAICNWKAGGDDRVVGKFWGTLLVWPLRTWLAVGSPMVVSLVGVAEVKFFSASATPQGAVCLAVGVLTAAIGTALTAYVSFFLGAGVSAPVRVLWVAAATAVCRKPAATFALAAEAAAGAVVGFADPALVVVVVPVAVLLSWYRTARWGAMRSGVVSAD